MPECTKAEREYLDSRFADHADPWRTERLSRAVLAERRAAEQGSVTPTNEAHEDEYARQVAEARISSLEAALAEERAKPKEGAVRHETQEGILAGSFHVIKSKLEWVGHGSTCSFTGPDAERHAREHAARLQAEHDAKGVTG